MKNHPFRSFIYVLLAVALIGACQKRKTEVEIVPAIEPAPLPPVAPVTIVITPPPAASPAAVPIAPQGAGAVIEPAPAPGTVTAPSTLSATGSTTATTTSTTTTTEVIAPAAVPSAVTVPVAPPAAPTAVEAGTMSTTEKVGVLECDKYVSNYVSCISTNVPAAERTDRIRNLETSIRKWQTMAASEQGRTDAANECLAARDLARQDTRNMGCEWQNR